MRRAVTLTKQKKQTKAGLAEYWVLRWFDSSGKCCSESLGHTENSQAAGQKEKLSQYDALKKRDAKRNEIANGISLCRSQEITIKTLQKTYVQDNPRNVKHSTWKSYNKTFLYLSDCFGDNVTIDGISQDDASLFQAFLESHGLSSETIKTHLRQSKAAFQHAVIRNFIYKNPFSMVHTAPSKISEWRYISKNEFNRLQQALSVNHRVLVSLCRLAGLKKSEACNLKWLDIDFKNNKIHVCNGPQIRSPRTIPLFNELKEILLSKYTLGIDKNQTVCPVNAENLW